MFAYVFTHHNWTAVTCSDSQRARDAFRGDAHFDAVLVGYRFDGVDGVDLIKQIRALDHLQCVPIVMVTGTIGPNIVAAALAAGADDVLHKPIDPTLVVATVTKCLERRRGWSSRAPVIHHTRGRQ